MDTLQVSLVSETSSSNLAEGTRAAILVAHYGGAHNDGRLTALHLEAMDCCVCSLCHHIRLMPLGGSPSHPPKDSE